MPSPGGSRGGGHEIVGIDNLNDYYDVSLQQARLDDLEDCDDVRFERVDREAVAGLFAATGYRPQSPSRLPAISAHRTGLLE